MSRKRSEHTAVAAPFPYPGAPAESVLNPTVKPFLTYYKAAVEVEAFHWPLRPDGIDKATYPWWTSYDNFTRWMQAYTPTTDRHPLGEFDVWYTARRAHYLHVGTLKGTERAIFACLGIDDSPAVRLYVSPIVIDASKTASEPNAWKLPKPEDFNLSPELCEGFVAWGELVNWTYLEPLPKFKPAETDQYLRRLWGRLVSALENDPDIRDSQANY